MAEKKEGNAKFYSRFSFSSVSINDRNVAIRKRIDLAKMFPAGMGAIYSFEFSVGTSDVDNDQARLHYIGLSFSNPTMERIEGHREDANSASKRTLDYLAYAAASYNLRPDAKNVEKFSDLVEVINIVSIFDLALMERYYIEIEKTQGSGASTYDSFDEMVRDRNFINGKKFTTSKIPLNTESGGQGGPIIQNALRSGETSRVVTPEDIVFGALAFIEENDEDVLAMRSKYMPQELKSIKDNSKIINKYKLNPKASYETILPYKVHDVIETFAKLGAAHTSAAIVLKESVQKSMEYQQAKTGAEKAAVLDRAKSAGNFAEELSLQGYFQSLSAQKEVAKIKDFEKDGKGKEKQKPMKESYIDVSYIAKMLKISGYDYEKTYVYGDKPDYKTKFTNKKFAENYSRVYQVDTTKPTMFKYFAQGFLSILFSDNPDINKFLKDFDVQLSNADKKTSQKAINEARKSIMETMRPVIESLGGIATIEMINEIANSKKPSKKINIQPNLINALKSKKIKDIAVAVDRIIEVLDTQLPVPLSTAEKIFLHSRIRNIAFAFNLGKMTTG